MYEYVTPGFWLLLLSVFVTYFPQWFVLRNYEWELEDFVGKFLVLYLVETARFFISIILCILIWVFLARRDLSEGFAVLSMFSASTALLPAFFSAATGIYLVINRKGYYCYQHSKSSVRLFPTLTDEQVLKYVGRLQFLLIIVLIGVSLVYVLPQ